MTMSRITRVSARVAMLGGVAMCLASVSAGAQQAAKPPVYPPQAKPPAAAGPANAPVALQREVFVYTPSGRRDPFVSLATTNDLRPLVSDLKLVGVLADPSGRRSVAVLRDLTDKSKQYRVTVGSTLGRMRVARITARDVTFTIEEFGRNRQVVLSYAVDSLKRTP